MKLSITYQESYSRSELLLRSFLGVFYITLPHVFLLVFCQIWSGIITFIAFWSILFTGKYPQSFFEYQVQMFRWSVRLQARARNMVDGYPAFFPSGTDTLTNFEMEYPENLSKGTLLLKMFFGFFYCILPHAFVLIFRTLWGQILTFIAWWVVLFTGRYPQSTHEFNKETILWGLRVNAYIGYMTDVYPPFNGKPNNTTIESSKKTSNLQAYFTVGMMVIELFISILIYLFVLGDGSHFEGGNNEKGHPIDIFGTVFKGGFIVPILITIVLLVITFAIERMITIMKAKGSGNISDFVRSIRELVAAGNIDEAMTACERQKGSIGNVVLAGLEKYKLVAEDKTMDKEQKIAAVQKDLEESTSLELPMLSKNLVILSTCASISTLIGLIGTVMGMIRSFAALANAGAPDSNALATGISEALVNTFIGIAGSCLAIVAFNVFTTQIDRITYGIDEANFSILQTIASKKH